ncbi:MAG: hypothetical protein ACI4QI_08860 [Candidatus Coproplasma sp.]
MNKNTVFKVLVGVLFLAVSVLWLLSAVLPDTFGGLSFAWLIAIFAFGMGVLFIARGILIKELTSVKKFYVVLGVLFLVAGVCALIGTFIPSVQIALPVVAIVLSLGLLISTLFVQGKKWDAGDNQEPGYKNYWERKAEKEKLEADKAAAEAPKKEIDDKE